MKYWLPGHSRPNILEGWQPKALHNLPVYEAGTWGPPGIDEFIEKRYTKMA